MPISPGTRIGPYEVVSLVGAGGMGEVYKAHDTRLHRTVALKVLPSHLSGDSDRRQRFHREAEAVAALDHPNICVLYDIGEHNGTDYLVMEHLEGETLEKRLQRGPLPLDVTVEYLTDIAGALDKAHRAGVVHRDLKPGNIMLTKSGPKLLDFGLAKLLQAASGAGVNASAPTETALLTREGMVLGTPQYMAPEQIEGKNSDARTDIFAFGAILFEMITGRRAFDPHNHPSLIGAILRDDPPPISALQPSAPPALERLVRICLSKNPDDRWQCAGDLRHELSWIWEQRRAPMLVPRGTAFQRSANRAAIIALTMAVLVLSVIVVRQLSEATGGAVARLTIDVPDSVVGTTSAPVAQISPDGRRVAFILEADRVGPPGRHIWLRDLDAQRTEPVPGTETAVALFWSPDSQQVAFTTNQSSVKKLTVSNKAVETVCADCGAGGGRGTWSLNGLIVFPSAEGPLVGVSGAGGKPGVVTTVNRSEGETAHLAPHFLPDGERFLYVIRNVDTSRSGLYVGRVGATERAQLLAGEHPAVYAAPGYLLYTRADHIVAQAFDIKRLQLKGGALPLVAPSEYMPTPIQGGDFAMLRSSGGWPSFSTSDTGMLTYAIAEHPESQFQWVTRAGKLVEMVGEPGAYQTFDLSRDGTRLVFSRHAADHASLWTLDLSSGITSQLTFGASSSFTSPRWGPESAWVAAIKSAPPPLTISEIRPDGREAVIPVAGQEGCMLDDVARDGRYLLCRRADLSLVALPVRERIDPIVVRKPPSGHIDQSHFSPDGRWVAYNANETGRFEIYVTAFPTMDQRWKISRDGGVQPVWRQDGGELYFLGLDGILNAIELRPDDRRPFSAPKPLFKTGLATPSPSVEQYAASADGARFLILKPIDDQVRNSIGVILNWPAFLRSSSH